MYLEHKRDEREEAEKAEREKQNGEKPTANGIETKEKKGIDNKAFSEVDSKNQTNTALSQGTLDSQLMSNIVMVTGIENIAFKLEEEQKNKQDAVSKL